MEKDGGVIWITGFPCSGKTSVGSEVEQRIRKNGDSTIILDGDHLRALFGQKWGYSREERVNLAITYLQLSNYLSRQGHTVVLCAVAMFDEVENWAAENINRYLKIFLDVPEKQRLERANAQGKTVYQESSKAHIDYDDFSKSSVCINNDDNVNINDVVSRIVSEWMVVEPKQIEAGRKPHWAEFYKNNKGVLSSSPFAEFVASHLPSNGTLLEIGCGNGRDAVYFCQLGQKVTGTDISEEAIAFCRDNHIYPEVKFYSGHLPNISYIKNDRYDSIYSRFCLHAMTEKEELEVLEQSYALLQKNGHIYIECRSINDPLSRMGDVLSPTERFFGHYRRFIRRQDLESSLVNIGFDVIMSMESNGLAVFGEEDPVVIRIIARKL